jgi:uncharacterized cofD-like protein
MPALDKRSPVPRTNTARVQLQRPAVGWAWVSVAGVAALSLALAGAVEGLAGDGPWPALLSAITLRFLPPWARVLTWALLGVSLLAVGLGRLNRLASTAALLQLPPAAPQPPLVEPRIVAVGGGHGLSALLRGLKNHTSQLTAIVTVADDGGSSGLLRRETGMLPPGDARNCIVALAQTESLMTQLFEYRFGRGAGLDGHAFGNLFIAAMAGITGSFEGAISQASRVLAVRGRILPSTLQNVTLCGEVRCAQVAGADGNGAASDGAGELRMVYGESAITEADGVVERVYLQPDNAHGYPEAIRALLEADIIVLGPGSLYTSILPNLLVPDICAAIKAAHALKVYACNVATQRGETDGYTVGDHVRALSAHLGSGFCRYVVANARRDLALTPASGSALVEPVLEDVTGCEMVVEDVVDEALPWRHDPAKLAAAIMRLYETTRSESDAQN